jgi:hypothetical protein
MSGRERDLGRTFASGAMKRKAKEEKVRKHKELLLKMPKLTSMFESVKSTSRQTVEVEEQLQNTDEILANEMAPDNASQATKCLSAPESSQQVLPVISASLSYSSDLGEWPNDVTDAMQDYWIERGSGECQHVNSDYSVSKRI